MYIHYFNLSIQTVYWITLYYTYIAKLYFGQRKDLHIFSRLMCYQKLRQWYISNMDKRIKIQLLFWLNKMVLIYNVIYIDYTITCSYAVPKTQAV